MRLSIVLPHGGLLASPQFIRDFAQAIEGHGFGGIGFFDHIALPRSVDSEYTLGPQNVGIPDDNLKKTLTPLYECLSTMLYVAGITSKVRLETGVLVLPLRNPVYNARQIGTLDAFSGGRVDLGIGVGWLKEEADMIQMPWDQRGARTEEHIKVMRTLWECDEPYVSFKGQFYEFEEIDPQPHPAQRPLPILVGGHAPVAKKRVGRIGDGWLTSQMPPEVMAAGMDDVRAAAVEAGRDPERLLWHAQGDARWENGAPKAPDRVIGTLRGYRDIGCHSVMISTKARTTEDNFALLDWLAKEVLPEFAG